MKLRAIVVDDEEPARTRLCALLKELDQVDVVGEARSAAEALRLLPTLDPDLLYLDVRMPGMSGVELARHLATLEDPPAVIFTTAFDEHAMAAFDAEAVGYLLKPVRREKLAAATERARQLTSAQLGALGASNARTHLAVRQREGLKLLKLEDVICLIAEQKYTTVRHTGGEDLIDDSLRALEAEFGNRFIRVHRSALVNRDYIEAIDRTADGQHQIRLRGREERMPVSRRLASELKAHFQIPG
ncbi:MAG TPA: LytTR family DNA-binding domain-containing protein [Steroidobacteraceae bacterium]|nr:LytTR family DNA-binding domain-containing protein [Steroidobacteraceae bacterium]